MPKDEFLIYALNDLMCHGVEISLMNKELVKGYGGFYQSNPPKMSVSYNEDDFLELFVHEYCHFVQHTKTPTFFSRYGHCIFVQWLFKHHSEISQEKLLTSMEDAIRLEHNCEKLVIEHIKKFKLPIDIEDYCRKANCYLFSFWFAKEKRKMPNNIYSPFHQAPAKIHNINFYLNESRYLSEYKESFLLKNEKSK